MAAPEDYQGRPIRAIEFRPEKQPYSREVLDRILPLKVDAPLRLAEVRAAIGQYVEGENIAFGASVVLASGSK